MSYRESKIQRVIEDSERYPDEYSKIREIENITNDHGIRHYASQRLRDVNDGLIDARAAARRIDEEQDYYDRCNRGEL